MYICMTWISSLPQEHDFAKIREILLVFICAVLATVCSVYSSLCRLNCGLLIWKPKTTVPVWFLRLLFLLVLLCLPVRASSIPLWTLSSCSSAWSPLFLLPHLASYVLACLSFPYTNLIFLSLSVLCQSRCPRLMFLLHASLYVSSFLCLVIVHLLACLPYAVPSRNFLAWLHAIFLFRHGVLC
jgi:hypothetical protein